MSTQAPATNAVAQCEKCSVWYFVAEGHKCKKQRSKFGVRLDPEGVAKRTVDGIVFHSEREAKHFVEFRALERSGAIRKLERQVRFDLHAGNSERISCYIADFVVTEHGGQVRIYDSKGHRDAVYRLKKKWFEAEYGTYIVEI